MDFPLQFSISSTSLLLTVFETTPSARSLHNVLAQVDDVGSTVLILVLARPTVDEWWVPLAALRPLGERYVLNLHSNAVTDVWLYLQNVVLLLCLLLWGVRGRLD